MAVRIHLCPVTLETMVLDDVCLGVPLWPVQQCRLITLGVRSGWCDPLSVLQQWRHAFPFHPRDFDTLVLHYVWLGVIWSVFCQGPSVLLFALCTVTLIWRHSLPLICESRPVTSALFGISGSVVPTYCGGSLSTLTAYRIPYYYRPHTGTPSHR